MDVNNVKMKLHALYVNTVSSYTIPLCSQLNASNGKFNFFY